MSIGSPYVQAPMARADMQVAPDTDLVFAFTGRGLQGTLHFSGLEPAWQCPIVAYSPGAP